MATDRLRAAILVVSETAAQDPSSDTSGKGLRAVFGAEAEGKWIVAETKIVGDNVLDIQRSVLHWTDGEDAVNLVVTSGGTGFAVKDVTPEAITPLLHKHAPGLVHGMLAGSLKVTPFAMMARLVAGVRNKTLIITVPGSPKGAKENLESILKLLPHACIQAAGADSRGLHAGGIKKLEQEAGVGGETTDTKANAQGHERAEHSHPHGCGHFHGGHATPIPHTTEAHAPRSSDPQEGPTRRHRASPYPMLSVDEALRLIALHTPPPQIVTEPVDEFIVGSVLAEDVRAAEPVPAFRASIVDGYATHVSLESPNTKGTFPVSLVSHATPGETPALREGEIARITTGAPLPSGANAVVMVEDTVLRTLTEDGKEEKVVEILTDKIKPGENIREVGSDIMFGEVVLQKGSEITAGGGELGLLASVGKREVQVYKKPTVGVLSTGDELLAHDKPGELRIGEVRDCNRPTLLAILNALGFETLDLGIVGDKAEELEGRLREGLRACDVLVTTGGASMGELDLMKPTIERQLGGTVHFGRVAMKPGKPTTFATVPVKDDEGVRISKVIFSLPGNPASAAVTLYVFVLPSLNQTCGIRPVQLPKVVVTLDHDIQPDPQRLEYHRALVTAKKDGLLHASSTGGQRSSRIGSLSGANAFVFLEPGAQPYAKGAMVEAAMIGRLASEFAT
ncbi:MAG: hypothetical protein M1816_007421 [Peltula sp. TS41687]|nr:MAG: hypothetical protein M1816_007421 [Peltula sp. TS41687]